MNLPKSTACILLLSLIALAIEAQTPRKRTATRQVAPQAAVVQPTPQPAASTVSPPERKAPTALVEVNGQTITTADIDPEVAAEVEALDEKIGAARRQVLDVQINTLLLEAEARKRRMSSQQLYEMEVAKRISDPTEPEILKFIEENDDRLGEGNVATKRGQVIAFLRSERETKLSDELVKRLRTSTSVVMGADPNLPNLSPTVVLATVGGVPITAAIINELSKPIIYKLRLSIHQAAREAADKTITDLLLLAEANRRNVPPEEIVRTEVTEKLHSPTEAEVAKFYADNKERIGTDLDQVRNQVATYLQDEEERRLRRELSDRLRKGASVRWLITEPEPPRMAISVDDDPVQGAVGAPVTLVEFTDFQCPACAAMQPVLEEVLKAYGPKIRLVVRDFPLPGHANARKAAEAAAAANAQGKFFEYAALLFKRQNALDIASLRKYATELGLDRTKFDTALDNGTYAAEVRHDIVDGQAYGVESTPTIFVNGVKLTVLNSEGLRASIDRALAAAGKPGQ